MPRKYNSPRPKRAKKYGWFTYMTGEQWPHDQGEIYKNIYSHGALKKNPAQNKNTCYC